jgi:hypothetical protein
MNTIIKKANFDMIENIVKILKKHKAYLYGSYVYKSIIRNNSVNLFHEEIWFKNFDNIELPIEPVYNGFDRVKYNEDINKFIQEVENWQIRNRKSWDERDKEYNESYYNPDKLPEYKDRMIEYDSIDCYMTDYNFEKLKDVFEKSDYSFDINMYEKSDYHRFGYMYEKNTYFMAEIILKSEITKDYQLKLNIIYSKDIDNTIKSLFKNFQFDCDRLIMTPYNNFVIIDKFRKTQDQCQNYIKICKIIEDIKKKITKLVDVHHDHQNIEKNKLKYILNQGLNIYNEHFITVDKSDEMCIICLEKCNKNKKYIKDIDCSAHYCIKCYDIMTNHKDFAEECPMCKSDIHLSDIEINFIKAMIEL